MNASSHKKTLIAALAAAAIVLSGCSADAGSGDTNPAASGSAISITDQRGKEVSFDKPVEKIATAVIPSPAIIAAVDGSWDRIVGINQSTADSNKQGIVSKIFPESLDTPVVSTRDFTPDMETILGLSPDVMIQWGDMGDDVVAPIEQAGIPMLGLEYGTQEDLETWITMFGAAIGKDDRAQDMIERMDRHEQELSAKVEALDAPKPRGLSLSYTDEGLSVSNGEDYAQHIFDVAGVDNVAQDVEVEDGIVDPEKIIEWDPEIIFLSAFDEATPEDFYNDPRFSNLTAVKEKRVYRSPLGVYRWQVPCAESALYWNWVASLAYPGQLDIDLPAMMKEEIQYLYNYQMTEEDIDLVLVDSMNSASANYEAVTG